MAPLYLRIMPLGICVCLLDRLSGLPETIYMEASTHYIANTWAMLTVYGAYSCESIRAAVWQGKTHRHQSRHILHCLMPFIFSSTETWSRPIGCPLFINVLSAHYCSSGFMRSSYGWNVSALTGIRSIPIVPNAILDGATTSLNNATVFSSPRLNRLREHIPAEDTEKHAATRGRMQWRGISQSMACNCICSEQFTWTAHRLDGPFQAVHAHKFDMDWLKRRDGAGWVHYHSEPKEFIRENFIGGNQLKNTLEHGGCKPFGGARFLMKHVRSFMESPPTFEPWIYKGKLLPSQIWISALLNLKFNSKKYWESPFVWHIQVPVIFLIYQIPCTIGQHLSCRNNRASPLSRPVPTT